MSERDLPERLDRYGGQVDLKRIALNKADTRRLPGFDVATKSKDPRHQWFVRKYGRRCWELDALNPNALRQRVRLAIWSYIDQQVVGARAPDRADRGLLDAGLPLGVAGPAEGGRMSKSPLVADLLGHRRARGNHQAARS